VFICACIGNETPLKPIQMLWVNLIMDSLGSLALATEPPYDELLQREPTKRNESIISALMWKHISIQSLVQLILLIIMFLIAPEFMKEQNIVRLAENYIILDCYGELPGGKTDPDYIIYGPESKWGNTKLIIGANEEKCGNYADRQDLSVAYKEYQDSQGGTVHMTLIFTIFVFYTLFNQFNCRIINDQFNIFVRITRSLLFPLITLFEMALQVILVQFGNTVFHCCERGLTGKQWGICLGFSAITFVVSIICKLIPLEKCIQPILDKYGGDDQEEEEGEGEANKVEKKEKVVNKKNNNNSNFESIDSSIKIKINKNADREIYNVIVESDSSKENNQAPQSDNKKLTIKEKKELIE
jgi:magnesium-transporting ATPase (P-type)